MVLQNGRARGDGGAGGAEGAGVVETFRWNVWKLGEMSKLTQNSTLPIAYCPLPIAYCLLPIACSLFPDK
ncbi:hypothetical protein [Coleofasciculus sp. E2-BRE-01]|uniref:hypothetical protein n=1 Tax=Coleofasciculus sp. E2-BRE-01 TaxID=3069524 RepID=UPI0032FC81CB